MSVFGTFDIFDSSPSILTVPQTLHLPLLSAEPDLHFPLDLFDHNTYLIDAFSSPRVVFKTLTDLTQIEKTTFSSCYSRIRSTSGSRYRLKQSLYDRVLCLESGFDCVAGAKVKEGDRKYTWTTEIKCPERKGADRKYELTAEIKSSEKHGNYRKYKLTSEIESPERVGFDRKYKWTAEIKEGKGVGAVRKHDMCTAEIKGKHKSVAVKIKEPQSHAGVCIGGAGKGEKKTAGYATWVVEIEEPVDQGATFLRQAFARRAGEVAKARGKRKVLSPQDAALMIQMSFRAYLIRRSKALRSLRMLAVAKAKLKEIRAMFNNFLYRQRIARDAEERQRFSEKIIALLLAVDAIEGADLMVRAARRSMLDELEAMLDVIDPQPPGKFGLMKRRMFDLPVGGIEKEIATGVAEVVQMLDQAEKYDNDTFEVCL